jgi:glycosidase
MQLEIARGDGRDILLQAFHWNLVKTQGTGTLAGSERSWYRILEDMADAIADLGATIVYLPPPWRDDSEWASDGKHGGGEGYFWHDFDLDSRYGTKAELTSLIRALDARGLHTIVDLVPNHRDGSRMVKDRWPLDGDCWAQAGGDTGAGFLDGRHDLNLGHPVVHDRVLAALRELTEEVGVDGWRWDFVWGFSIENVVEFIHETPKVEYFSMGEYWQGSPDLAADPLVWRYGRDEAQRILGWARDTGSCAYDIPLKRAINSGDPARLGEGLNSLPDPSSRAMMVTYVDNHDTGASPWSAANGWGQQHWPCPPHFKTSAYAFILSMPGVPAIYWPDAFDWGLGDTLRALVRARRHAGIEASSQIERLRHHSGYAAIVRGTRGHLALSIGSDFLDPGPGWEKWVEEEGRWTVWVR